MKIFAAISLALAIIGSLMCIPAIYIACTREEDRVDEKTKETIGSTIMFTGVMWGAFYYFTNQA